MCSVSYTDSVLPDTVSSLLMPPFLGSRSGERERRAMTASRDEGKGTSREMQEGQGKLLETTELMIISKMTPITFQNKYIC